MVLVRTIKRFTTKFLHYTYYHLIYIVYHFSSKLQNITLDENDIHMKILPGKALLQQCLH
jgi:hypothetical protein